MNQDDIPAGHLHFDRCCNPFRIQKHCKKKGLRYATTKLIGKLSTLTKYDRLCRSCEDRINKTRNLCHSNVLGIGLPDADPISSSSSSFVGISSQESNLSATAQMPVINHALELLGNSPIIKRRAMSSAQYIEGKVDSVRSNLLKSIGIQEEASTYSTSECVVGFKDMIKTIKEIMEQPGTKYEDKLQLLTLMPQNWSVQRVAEEMGVTLHMARRAKTLRHENGAFSKPEVKKGRAILDEVKLKVSEFYEDDRISAIMSGMKDFISVRNKDGIKVHKQKRLILSNLKELYCYFKQEVPEIQIGFSSFASLRPAHCVLAGSSGTHTVCVCSAHQNMKLMIRGCKLENMTTDTQHPLATYEDCLSMLTCTEPQAQCYFGTCDECPGSESLKDHLLLVLNECEHITYKQWIMKPRCSLETQIKSVTEFIDEFCQQARQLLCHAFIAKSQANFLRELKDTLEEDNFIVVCDFAENYAFVVQDAAPGFHWNNNQSTIYPVVIYFKVDGVLHHRSLVIISSCLRHDAVAVYVFSKLINSCIRTINQAPKKIFYFSDGAPQQFKNYKNFLNLHYHKLDFDVVAEWHFFATAHGKGPCDGLGGTIKRLAARASLQLPPEKQITTPHELYMWASQDANMPSVSVRYTDENDYLEAQEFLSDRFKTGKPIPNTHKLHCLIPVTDANMIKTKRYSKSPLFEVHRISKSVPSQL